MACGWESSYAQCAPESPDAAFLEGVDPAVRAQAEEMATDLLDAWTGGVYGPCPFVVRPCTRPAPGRPGGEAEFTRGATSLTRTPWLPVLLGGQWYNIGCGSCGMACGCDRTAKISLPHPTHRVLSVQIDGEILPQEAYRLEDRRLLVRQDGGAWPKSQDLVAPLGEPNTWGVEIEHGYPVPEGGKVAAGMLALEFMRALCNDASCQLPTRVQTVTRQGVSMAMLDTFDDLDEGHTGIWLVDSWVASVTRPKHRGGAVYSVDLMRRKGRGSW